MPPRHARRRTPQVESWTISIPPQVKILLHTIGRLADAQALDVYAVGGCVRDWMLGATRTTDLDVVVAGDGIAFARRVAQVCDATVHPHEQFGTAALEFTNPETRKGKPPQIVRLDIASCRKEVYREPAAYPTVSAGTLQEDLFRRDFTMNAMAVAISGTRFGCLVDLFGGRADLTARRLRILHPNSFVDDPSRILRAVRFMQRFDLSLESKTRQCLRQAIAHGVLTRLNRGRLRKELERLVLEPDPWACLASLGQWLQQAKR